MNQNGHASFSNENAAGRGRDNPFHLRTPFKEILENNQNHPNPNTMKNII